MARDLVVFGAFVTVVQVAGRWASSYARDSLADPRR